MEGLKKILFSLLLLWNIAEAQNVPGYTYFNTRNTYFTLSVSPTGTFHFPSGDGAVLGLGAWNRSGALYYDSTGADSGLYVYHRPYWVKVGGTPTVPTFQEIYAVSNFNPSLNHSSLLDITGKSFNIFGGTAGIIINDSTENTSIHGRQVTLAGDENSANGRGNYLNSLVSNHHTSSVLSIEDSGGVNINRINRAEIGYGIKFEHNTLKADTASFLPLVRTAQTFPQPYGLFFKDSSSHWTIAADFIDNGASSTDSAGHLVVSGGTSSLDKTTDINRNQTNGLDGYTDLEDWIFEIKARVIQHGTLPIGIRSARSGLASTYGFINTATGASTYITNSASNLTVSLKDYITIRVERHGEKTAITVRNITTNSAPITTYSSYIYSGANYPPVTGRFAIFNFSGKFYIDSVYIWSGSTVNSSVAIIGDSKSQWLPNQTVAVGRTQTRYGTSLSNIFPTVVMAGANETTADWELRVNEVIAHHPWAVLLSAPSNDLRTAVNTDSTRARYYRIERRLRTAGIHVFHMDGFYESATNQYPWSSYIRGSRSVDSVIVTYAPTSVSGTLEADGIHPNERGNQIIYDQIIGFSKLMNSVPMSNSPSRFIQNLMAAEAAQIGNINLIGIDTIRFTGNYRFNGYGLFGTGVAASSIGTVPVVIKLRPNANLFAYGNSSAGENITFAADNLSTKIPGNIIASVFEVLTGTAGTTRALQASSTEVFINPASAAFNFRVSSGGNANMLKVDGTNNRVGIGLSATTDVLEVNGNTSLVTAGNKIKIATGSNASIGVSAAMTAGTITISTTAVTASSKIFLVHATTAGTQGILSVGTIVAGTSFVINSSSATDTGTVNWWIIN